MGKTREERAKVIVNFFLERPMKLSKVRLLYYPFREYKLMMRVFGHKNTYNETDLRCWEFVMKKIKQNEKKKREKKIRKS